MLYAQLHAAAPTDAKTGLLNDAAWEREAAAGLAAARRHGQPAARLLLDIDHFKRVNDTYGHLVSDDVHRGLADFLRAQVRDIHDPGMPVWRRRVRAALGLDANQAPRATDRLRERLAAMVLPAGGAEVTVSIGIAVSEPGTEPAADMLELLAAADLRLYQAKAAAATESGSWPNPTVGTSSCGGRQTVREGRRYNLGRRHLRTTE